MRPHPDVLAAHLDGETVLLHLGRKRYFRLNRTGATVWREIERGAGDDAIVTTLRAEFDVTPDDASAALVCLIDQLRQADLVTDAPAP